MYLSRLVINNTYPSVMRDIGDPMGMHKRLMRAFPDVETDAARKAMDILFRVEVNRGRVQVYVQSMAAPDWSLLETRSFSEPPQVKRIEEAIGTITDGRILRFRLRANPIKRLKVPGKKNGRKVGILREEDQAEWLKRRGSDSGFSVINLQVQREGLIRTRDGKAFESTVFDGTLRVDDSRRFIDCVQTGVGSGKAYGFGLLSIAPAAGVVAERSCA